jgi:predicted metal-dependent HD superfamily phosphohydrolase
MPDLTGHSNASIEKAWDFANEWWLADSRKRKVVLDEILTAMRSRGGYHTVSHIERMLTKYDQWCGVTGANPDPRLVGWIFAHDLVYTPGAPNNEEESATQMDQLLQEMGARHRIDQDDRIAIESTKSHQPVDSATLTEPALVDAIHLLHDLDLEILGSSRRDYDGYVAAVYAEYLGASVDPANFPKLWLQGRKAFLQGMLQREPIFKTPLFAMFDRHARDNMRDELGKILDQIGM